MDAPRFDRLTCFLAAASSRQALLRGLGALAVGMTSTAHGGRAKKRKQKLKRNAFGCVNVGGTCRGTNAVCCSGICQGKRPTQGKRDRSRCVAHDESDCAVGSLPCSGPELTCKTSSDVGGLCYTTTGNAAYCAKGGICFTCARDADCRPFCGPAAACVKCAACESPTVHTACVGISGCTPP